LTNKLILYTLPILFLLQGCITYEDNPYCDKYKYITFEELSNIKIKVEEAKEMIAPAKIIIYENLLLVNEPNKGVHII